AESQSGYLRVSDAPYEEEPILRAASGVPRRFIARRFTEEEAEGRSHRRQSRPAQQPPARDPQQSRPTQQQQPPFVRVSQQSRPTQQQPPFVRVSQQSRPTQQQQPPVRVSQQVRPVYEASSCGWGEQQRWSVPRPPSPAEQPKWTVPRYPSPLKIGDVTDLTPSEIAVHRTDTGVDILRRGRLWRISSYPEYARGEIPPWRGLEMALDDGRRRFENGKITMRITELERILSIGLTECDNEGCLCRSKYPGVVQEMTGDKCPNSTGFSSSGKHWDRGRLVQETAYQMKVGDVVSLHLHTDGSGLYIRALELVVNGQLYPATLQAKRCGRLILKGSGAWSVALLLGVDPITTPQLSDHIVEEVTTPSTMPSDEARKLPLRDSWN
ncbi:hypothetical protein FOZ63_006591, partial [Perkinsus olseni]